VAVNSAREAGFNAEVCDISNSVPTGRFNVIFCFEVLEHIVDPLRGIDNLKKALNPGGKLIISLPNEFHIVRRMMILMGRIGFAGHDYHHLRFFDLNHAKRFLREAHMRILGNEYAPLVPLYWGWLFPLGELLKRIRPQLFAISFIWLLEPE